MDKTVKLQFKRSDGAEFLANVGEHPDWKIPSDGLDGFGGFNNDLSTINNAIGNGGIITANRMGLKDRTIMLVSRNKHMNDVLRRQAISFFSPKYTYAVYITYMGITRWFEGVIHKFLIPAENVNANMEMTITFMSENPFLKSYDNFGKNIASVTGRIAFPFICSIDNNYPRIMQGITGGQFNFAQTIYLENDGDVDAYCKCIFEATGAVTNPKLIINGNYVRVIDEMDDGDVIEIDFTKNPPTVKKNGVNYVGHCDRTSAFDDMSLVIGESEVSFDADYGSNLLRVSIFYNKLYASI